MGGGGGLGGVGGASVDPVSSRRSAGEARLAKTTVMSSTRQPPVYCIHNFVASSARRSAASWGAKPATSTTASAGEMTSQRPSLARSSATSSSPNCRTQTSGSSDMPLACPAASPMLRDMLRPMPLLLSTMRWHRPSKTIRPPSASMRARSSGTSGLWSCVSASATSPSGVNRSRTARLSPTCDTTNLLFCMSCVASVTVVPELHALKNHEAHTLSCTRRKHSCTRAMTPLSGRSAAFTTVLRSSVFTAWETWWPASPWPSNTPYVAT
mmetsp:Transcript_93124/g.268988  ORF Transcript_93124/g.268988 Transcript_93124/m.268988 type:complete len:268 (+) Transcript_93124:478-1281(+)